jgi:ribosomal protein S7
MPRRRRAQERKILADPKYKSEVVAKFIYGMM